MNPVKSAITRNLKYTLHNDSPVVVAGVFNGRNTFIEILDSAVNRVTSGGRLLGADQRVTPYEALAGMTINSAWQAQSDSIKGSITVGKNADLIILSDNPLEQRGKRIKDIKVVTTIKNGAIVYGQY
jgi:predicted amidohydrolase YtcJ